MLQALNALVAPAVMERLTLVLNHVLAAESAATERLRARAGALVQLQLQNWPSLLPSPPALCWRVTPAGLLEWGGTLDGAAADLQVRLDAANPAGLVVQALTGQPPALQLEGDAGLAADINWLIENLRWDVAADLERVVGAPLAHQIGRVGGALAQGLRAAVQQGGAWMARRGAPTV